MFGWTRGRRAAVALCALGMLAVGSGCGGEDGGNAEADQIKWSAASEPSTRFSERMAKLLSTTTSKEDCPQLDQINQRSYFRFSCPPGNTLRKSMSSFEVVGSKEYGTGAVVDYRSGRNKDGAAILLFAAPDRNWGVSRFGIVTKPSTDTSDAESRDGYDDAVARYLGAVRDRECAALREVAYTDDLEGDVCKSVLANTKELAKRLNADPDAEPVYQGGNGTYGFYGIETQKPKPQNSTISLIKTTSGRYVVLDSAPSPTIAEQRRIRNDYLRQRKNLSNGSMEPSSKPSDPAVTP